MTATKEFIGNTQNHVNNSSTFEVWKDLTNDMATLIGTNSVVLETNQNAVTGSVGMANTGKLFLDGNIQLSQGRTLIADAMQATSTNKISINDDVLIAGVLHLNRDDGSTANPVEIQMQNGVDVNTWHLKTNTDHTQLRIGTPNRNIYFNDDGTVTTSATLANKFTFDNALLGPSIDGIEIGQNQHEAGKFTTLEATTGITGDLTGDILSSGGQQVLDNGSNGGDASFKGVIKTTDGTTILNNGATVGSAMLTGDITGNVVSESSAVVVVNTAPTTTVFTGNLVGNADSSSLCTGNSLTASTLQNNVLIGGVTFNGGSDIILPGVNAQGNQDTTGNADTASEISITDTEENVDFAVLLAAQPPAEGTAVRTVKSDQGGLNFTPNTNTLEVGGNSDGRIEAYDMSLKQDLAVAGNIELTGTNKKIKGGDIAKSDGTVVVDVSATSFIGNADSATTAAACTGNSLTATTLASPVNIGGVAFDGGSDIILPGVNDIGTENLKADVLSNNGDVCLQNGPSPELANFTGISKKSTLVRIYPDSDDPQEHYITFADGLIDVDGTVSRSSTTSPIWQNLEDSDQLTYKPSIGRLRVTKLNAQIVKADDTTVVVDTVNSVFNGNATTANHSSTSGRASVASRCDGTSAKATQVLVNHFNSGATSSHALLFSSHTSGENKQQSIKATNGLVFQPATNKIIFTGEINAQYFNGRARNADRLSNSMTINFSGDLGGSVSFQGDANKTCSLNVRDDATFTITANRIADLDSYVSSRYIHVDNLYPVGSVYTTTDQNFNPASYFGGLWSRYSQGTVIVGHGQRYSHEPDFNGNQHSAHPGSGNGLFWEAYMGNGGEYTHRLSEAEMPRHRHSIDTGWQYSVQLYKSAVTNIREFRDGTASTLTTDHTNYTGGGTHHNNMPPFVVAFVWRRYQ